ncbi:MAG: M48 family metallopeptidase [Alphaproteobacteria bacterium]|nr:M48 family metallopeptidase [Alphaproteobacteria bacterium]
MTLAALRKLIEPGSTGQPGSASLLVDGTDLPVTFKRNAQARRIILRMNPKGEGVLLTVPPGTTQREALSFAMSQKAWIAARLKRTPDTVGFADGIQLPLRGSLHSVCHKQVPRRTVWSVEANEPDALPTLYVSGRIEHLPRRLKDWLKAQARADLTEATEHYAREMGLKYSRMSIRDQSSRWGSCSSTGALSYSWRLILAPANVLDYVAAHEVAHLAEMNHGPAFWRLVERHCPQTKSARHWLKQHGRDLHRYGA